MNRKSKIELPEKHHLTENLLQKRIGTKINLK